MKKKTIN